MSFPNPEDNGLCIAIPSFGGRQGCFEDKSSHTRDGMIVRGKALKTDEGEPAAAMKR
jgi:hypothetical protein